MYSKPYNSKVQGAGLGDMDTLMQIVDMGTKTTVAVADAVRGHGGSSSAPKAQTSAQPAGEGFLSSLSNTELAIGGIAGMALLMNVMR